MTKPTIGILGGGQLGRMTAEAAARLGVNTYIYTPHADDCGLQVATDFTVADWNNTAALEAFARSVDVVTYEFENIPFAAVETVAAMAPVYPNPNALRTAQNRVREKTLCQELGIHTAPWREVYTESDARAALTDLGGAMIIKTAEMGYDGKGQWKIKSADELKEVFNRHPGAGRDPVQLIAEGIVDFDFEISVIAARGQDGDMVCYPAVRNEHRNHILWQTHAPAEISSALAVKAETYAQMLAEKLDVVGLLAVEMFVQGDRVLVNEMAPRPHNSGHWTIEGCACSQFEQLVRAVLGLPLGDVEPRGKFIMTNLIGDDFLRGQAMADEVGGVFHDYGKTDIRPGRKMGHVTQKV